MDKNVTKSKSYIDMRLDVEDYYRLKDVKKDNGITDSIVYSKSRRCQIHLRRF